MKGPQTVAEWLDEYVDSHSVYDTGKLAQLEPFDVKSAVGARAAKLTYGERSTLLALSPIGTPSAPISRRS
jgi:hypothetical protein